MRSFISFLIMAAALLAGGTACTPESRQALPEDYRIAVDARFVGDWRGGNEAGALQGSLVAARLAVDPAEPLDLLFEAEETWRTTDASHHRVLRGRLRFYDVAGRRIVAIQRLDGAPAEHTWRFATYRFSAGDEGVALYFMDEPKLFIQLRNGAFRGKIRGGEPEFPDLLINDDPEKLAALIRATDPEALFTARLGPFQRVPS